ncbi:MAG: TIGR03936 family radical SAM-associated protein [Lachnospiraceae bacterium]|nr:TIGR03936 family radical SAM-associated protein [Lachnospiraceae bacterium]
MKVRIKFSKQGVMKFIGHLDIMRYFQKAIRRAKIPIVFTEGFSPHMIMSFASPLGVGLTSSGEYMDIEVSTEIPSEEAVRRLNAVMVDGIQVLSYRRIEDGKAGKAMSLVAAADYTLGFRSGHEPAQEWKNRIDAFMAQSSINILKKTKKSEKEVDIKPMIYEMRMADNDRVFMQLAAGSAANLKPELVMEAFANYLGITLTEFALEINREELYAEGMVSLEDLGEEIGA